MNYLFMPWGRVGSNLVLDILAQSPEAGRVIAEPLTLKRTKSRTEAAVFFRQIRWLALNRATISVSVDSLACPAVLTRVMRGPAVYLDRRNTVKTAISAIRARHYAREHEAIYGIATWAVRPGHELHLRPEVDFPELMRFIREIEAGRKSMAGVRRRNPGPLIWYEDLADDIDSAMRTVWRTFGIPPHPYVMPSVKATGDDLRTAVANFDALASTLPEPYAAQLQ